MNTYLRHIALSLLAVTFFSSCERSNEYEELKKTIGDVRVDLTKLWPQKGKVSKLAKSLLSRNLMLIFDGSGSMEEKSCLRNERKIDVAKRVVSEFVEALPGDVRFGMIKFDASGTREVVRFGEEVSIKAPAAIHVIRAGGNTPLKTAIEKGYFLLEAAGRSQLGYGDYYLVVVTDGEPSPGEDPTSVVLNIVRDSPVQIFTIGFCIGEQHILNQPSIVTYRTAKTASQLSEGLHLVLAESEDFSVTSFQE